MDFTSAERLVIVNENPVGFYLAWEVTPYKVDNSRPGPFAFEDRNGD